MKHVPHSHHDLYNRILSVATTQKKLRAENIAKAKLPRVRDWGTQWSVEQVSIRTGVFHVITSHTDTPYIYGWQFLKVNDNLAVYSVYALIQ
jgi:hypothetical protein